MAEYRLDEVTPLTLLKEAFGDEVILEEGTRESQPFKILSEFSVGGREYAVLQSESMQRDQEVDVYRIVKGQDGGLELESVEDDEEWESVAELYDEMTVSFDE